MCDAIVDMGDDFVLQLQGGRAAVFGVQALQFLQHGAVAFVVVDIAGFAISRGEAAWGSDEPGCIQAQFMHGSPQFVAFSVVPTITDGLDRSDPQGSQIRGDGTGRTGLASVSNDLVAGTPRF